MAAWKDAYLNLNVRGLGPSATLAIKDTVRRLRAEGMKVNDLGLGQSPFPVPPQVVETLQLHAAEKDYLPVEGLPALRAEVARYHRRRNNLNTNADTVLVGPGSKELLFLLQLCYYGDIIVPTPCWVSYVPQAQIVGRRVRHIGTDCDARWRLQPEDLAKLCERDRDAQRPRLLVLNYPANPHGCTYTSDELAAIAEVARRYGVVILSDEIYGELHHEGKHVSIAEHYPEGTIVSTGISKWCGAGGWRLGTFTFPSELDWLRQAMAAVASETYTSVSAPIQYAAVSAFRGGPEIERYLAHARRILRRIGNDGTKTLTDAGVKCHPPEGAFYLFADFTPRADDLAKRGIHDSAEMCRRLLDEAGVAILPGSDFQRPPEELTARIAYVDFDGARAQSASEHTPLDARLPDDFTRTYCASTVEGFQRMVEWLDGGK